MSCFAPCREMLERERLEAVPVECGAISSSAQRSLPAHRQRMVETREDVDRLRTALTNNCPRPLHLREIGRGARGSCRRAVGQVWCETLPKRSVSLPSRAPLVTRRASGYG